MHRILWNKRVGSEVGLGVGSEVGLGVSSEVGLGVGPGVGSEVRLFERKIIKNIAKSTQNTYF